MIGLSFVIPWSFYIVFMPISVICYRYHHLFCIYLRRPVLLFSLSFELVFVPFQLVARCMFGCCLVSCIYVGFASVRLALVVG